MNIYADSSFFVSLYVTDSHSQEVKHRISKFPNLWFTPLHKVEWVHAIEQHVFRGAMSAAEAHQVYDEFERDERKSLWTEVHVAEGVFEAATQLARTHVSRLGTRTLDTLHVALAVDLQADEFWTFDERQAKLAKVAGLKVS